MLPHHRKYETRRPGVCFDALTFCSAFSSKPNMGMYVNNRTGPWESDTGTGTMHTFLYTQHLYRQHVTTHVNRMDADNRPSLRISEAECNSASSFCSGLLAPEVHSFQFPPPPGSRISSFRRCVSRYFYWSLSVAMPDGYRTARGSMDRWSKSTVPTTSAEVLLYSSLGMRTQCDVLLVIGDPK